MRCLNFCRSLDNLLIAVYFGTSRSPDARQLSKYETAVNSDAICASLSIGSAEACSDDIRCGLCRQPLQDKQISYRSPVA